MTDKNQGAAVERIIEKWQRTSPGFESTREAYEHAARTDNKKLIEALETAAGSPYMQPDHSDLVQSAIHALEAAEKALTPTDDEREALAVELIEPLAESNARAAGHTGPGWSWRAEGRIVADAILAAGFRRPEVLSRVVCPDCGGDGAMYEQVRVGQHATPFVCQRCDGDGDLSEPQGEPSSTDLIAWHVEQVEALRPFRRSSSHLKAAMMHAATVRALRAAGGAR